jgi:hypothetical protein
MEVRIDTFDELIEFLKTNDLTPTQANEIINKALKCFFIDDRPKNEMIEALIIHWAKWKHTKERPIFIDFDNPFDID